MSQTLLRKIQDAATDKTTDLPSLLRMCLVLASRLRNDTLKTWVNAELQGYESKESLPDYRIFPVPSELVVYNPLQGKRTIPIPRAAIEQRIPSEYVEDMCNAYIQQNVAQLIALVNAPGEGKAATPAVPWPHEFVALVAPLLSTWTPVGAAMLIGRQRLTGILDIVKTRVLQMSIDLDEAAPSLGEGNPADIPEPTEERIQQIVNNYTYNITGDHPIVSTPITQTWTRVVAGDLDSLRVALQQLGLTPEEIEQTALAVQEEKSPKGVLAKLKKAGSTLALKAAETGIAEVIKGFFA